MAQEMIEGINPTRMELLKLKQREKLAVKGHSLLKEKRNALIMEFFNILERVKGSRDEVSLKLQEAYQDLTAAQVMMGDLSVKKAAMSVTESVDVDIDSRSIMGVVVPVVESEISQRTIVERGYGFMDTSVKLDEAARKFEESIQLIIELGEIEKTIMLLASEIESTKRRVNALEHIIIPRLENTVKYIEMRLEEMERESFVRLKMVKKTMEESEEAI
ncbi:MULTISPECIES: V-type ATP synthase subunit D [Methanobacterium]|jgi:V/A-type H+-transporting ATPase subunit D|uniref:A-type ATP synthase subunit D n=1 Tax=Methanobacterium subterraneum TaxID=59277 RepID=A0A2H4VC65_9EURY|nr:MULTISPECIES: V-type ATP synthase subunit D [Methanobacterium]MBW4258225.1 V-type ATP synthase subunit D [Methanobacterium sp. YSL]PKL73366.1 MAG: V-type ATP synthase subunit D [Methanobacteriales archaeon HGW-Methanobacteriales-2]AUB55684.1 V-type ATP synthase subunit D [Methanobacterium subterraneum]AUB57327.1 V-type ATP synthase subunit D [Methanobacterium sp. MZ-A1]AUB60453.1 V-type ATP synthase subunit D [Methanobacterium subterraneum]